MWCASRRWLLCGALVGVAACSKEDEPTEFATPWADAAPSDQVVSGEFFVQLGSEVPGAGWFTSGELTAYDLSQAQVVDMDSTWPVVQVRILGREGTLWNVLELDIALNHWVAGTVPIDGDAAIGVLTTTDGSQRYLLGGELSVTRAGIEPGQTLRATFNDVPLTETP